MDKLAAANPDDPDLTDLINGLKNMLKALNNNKKPVDNALDDLMNKLKQIMDYLKKKGTFRLMEQKPLVISAEHIILLHN